MVSGLISRIDLQHKLKIRHGQAELVSAETGLATAIQGLLVAPVEIDHLGCNDKNNAQGNYLCILAYEMRPSIQMLNAEHLVAVLHYQREILNAQKTQR